MKKILLQFRAINIVLFLFCLLLLPTTIFAAEPIGTVIAVQGQAYAQDKTTAKRSLQRRSEIYLNDTIVTAKDSKVQIRLNDDSIIVMQPSTKFYVSEFSFNKSNPQASRYVGNIVEGALINISGQGKPGNYQLKSPVAALTFRGTTVITNLVTNPRKKVVHQNVHVSKGYITVDSCPEEEAAGKGPGEQPLIRVACKARETNVGEGQNLNAVTIEANGDIKKFDSRSLLNSVGLRRTDGGVSLQCIGG